MVKSLTQVTIRVIKGKRAKVYHLLSISYTKLLPILIQNYKIFAIPAKSRKPQYPKGYNSNDKCEYHGGVEGQSTKNYTTFKEKVQALIDVDLAKFKELVNSYLGY